MFGYVKPDKMQMRVREYEYYRGVYCGLCRSLGKCGGQCARMTLSYDVTFMALVRMSVLGVTPNFKMRNCLAHPFTKRNMAEPNDELKYCAAASLLLSYGKLKDDLCDEKGVKRLKAALLLPSVSLMKRRAMKKYAPLWHKIEGRLKALSDYERSCAEPSLDIPAEIFGELLADVISYGLEGSNEKIAKKIGRHLGKWIYTIDACDDYADDKKRKRFNPIIKAYGENGIDANTKDGLANALIFELMEAEKGFDLIEYPDKDAEETVKNIIYLGLPAVAEKILEKPLENKAEKDG